MHCQYTTSCQTYKVCYTPISHWRKGNTSTNQKIDILPTGNGYVPHNPCGICYVASRPFVPLERYARISFCSFEVSVSLSNSGMVATQADTTSDIMSTTSIGFAIINAKCAIRAGPLRSCNQDHYKSIACCRMEFDEIAGGTKSQSRSSRCLE